MEFRILGPLEAHSDGQALDLGGAKQRALLGVLLLHANSVVSKDRLIDALWEDDPPESAQKALQVHVSSLRKLVGKERLQTQAPGYVLRVQPDEFDLARFCELQEQGRLADALSLWRGPPLSDLAYRRFAHAEIGRLEDLRLACLEERIEHDLRGGGHGDLTGELEALVREHPLRERLRGQLMLALYRSGRQAEALAAYQDARRTLVEELGIEPGRELRELQQAILNQDPALDLVVARQPEQEEAASPTPPPSDSPPSARQSRKTVTAVFVAVSAAGADGGSLDPEALRRVTSRSFGEIQAAVERHGGTLETVSSDTLTAIFGVPVVHEDDALRAVRAAAETRQALADLAGEVASSIVLAFRIGLGTGEVVTGEAGPQLRVTGEPLITSARLAQGAEEGEVVLDERSYRLVRDAVVVDATGSALSLLEVIADLHRHVGRFASPMVGRERERRRLQDAFEQAVSDRSCQLFTVLGTAGVGKSRLVQEFLGDVSEQALIVRGRCLPYGEGITYWPVLEAVKEAAGIDDTDSPEDAKAKLVLALGDEPGAELVATRIADLIGLAAAALGVEEGFAAIQTLFETLARALPLVVVFDDIHWGEATFLDLLEHLAEWTRDAPILLICLARSELRDVRPGWAGGKPNATSVLLEPLSESESVELIENLASHALDEAAKQRVVDAAEGNPLFVEEMLALALEDGQPARELVVPPTIHALLAARLDRLGQDERAVVDRAAVQGKVFYEDALTALSPPELLRAMSVSLGSLLLKELIRPDRTSLSGRTFRFRHILIRDAAYDSIPKEARVEMHEGFARWLEGAAGERATEYEEIVGYHLEQAYLYRAQLGPIDEQARDTAREAAERLGAAGRRAFIRSDTRAGVNMISRAVALLPPEDPMRVDLVPNVRVVQGWTDLSWAEKALTEAVEAAATTGDRRLAAHALVQRALLRLFTEPDVTAEELFDTAERAIQVFDELQDELGLARSWRLLAQSHYLDRHLSACAEASERALVHAQRAGDRFEEREIVEWFVIALFLGPLPAPEAEDRCKRLLEQTAGDPSLVVQVLGGLAFLTAIQGRLTEAQELLAEARRTMDELGEWVWIFSWHVAFTSLLLADPVSAENEIRPAYDALKKIGEKSHFSTMAHALALSLYQQGRYDEAEHLAHECEEAARANDVNSRIMAHSVRAKVLARRGELEDAEVLARDAVALAAGSDLWIAHGDALTDLAEVLEIAGRPDEAIQTLSEAVLLYERKGDVVSASKARVRLAELRV
jgi:DNA-binding SARP family transcriptional activator/tetratricopeptide (TPR) repeat protein